jgi:hypothetical protein
MFPFILPSTVDPNSSLTVWDSLVLAPDAVRHAGLTVIFMPLILAYTSWVYKVLWGKVTVEDITENSRHGLLKETPDVVFRLASWPSTRRALCRRQRHVAGDA